MKTTPAPNHQTCKIHRNRLNLSFRWAILGAFACLPGCAQKPQDPILDPTFDRALTEYEKQQRIEEIKNAQPPYDAARDIEEQRNQSRRAAEERKQDHEERDKKRGLLN